jgi:hypothetical protein
LVKGWRLKFETEGTITNDERPDHERLAARGASLSICGKQRRGELRTDDGTRQWHEDHGCAKTGKASGRGRFSAPELGAIKGVVLRTKNNRQAEDFSCPPIVEPEIVDTA